MRLLKLIIMTFLMTIMLGCGQESGEFTPVTGGIDEYGVGVGISGIRGFWQQIDSYGDSYNYYWIFEGSSDLFIGEIYNDDRLHAEYCFSYSIEGNTLIIHTPDGDDYRRPGPIRSPLPPSPSRRRIFASGSTVIRPTTASGF